MLEEIEMAPRHLLGVVGGAVGGAAVRAGKAAARGEIDLDVEPLRLGIEVAAGHRPGRRQPQRHLQQLVSRIAVPLVARPGRGWRRARRRQGRYAPRKRGGLRPSLTAAVRGAGGRQAGTKKRPLSAEQRNLISRWRSPGEARGVVSTHARQRGGKFHHLRCATLSAIPFCPADAPTLLTGGSILPDLPKFWGKARPSNSEAAAMHPLLAHSLDVAAVALLLPRRLTFGLTGQTLGFLVALHDIGKLSRSFQAQVPEYWRVARSAPFPQAACHRRDHGMMRLPFTFFATCFRSASMMCCPRARRAAGDGLTPIVVTCSAHSPGIMDGRRRNPKSRRAAMSFPRVASWLPTPLSKPCGRSSARRH